MQAIDEVGEIHVEELLRPPKRFFRSTDLEKDFNDPRALDGYILTPFIEDALSRMLSGIAPESGRRAWRVTGDYGAGKSSFALMLAQLLAHGPSELSIRFPDSLLLGQEIGFVRFLPVLVTGSNEPLISAIANGICHSLGACGALLGKSAQTVKEIAEEVAETGNQRDLLSLVEQTRRLADKAGLGLCLVIDELGKLLEYASANPDKDDVFVLQRLAETAARSGEKPFILIGLLHQGFLAYAERLSSTRKHEWQKVAGRFEELVFDEPLVHSLMLSAAALNVDLTRLPEALRNAERSIWLNLAEEGWCGRVAAQEFRAAIYPLHPSCLAAAVRFFARFGQNERSLFSFLLSGESYGIQCLATRRANADGWYRLCDFYDYVRVNFGHLLSGNSHRNMWSRLSDVIDGATWATDLELRILKSVAILNVLDREDLLPTDTILSTALADDRISSDVATAVASLKGRGLLFERGRAGGYRLWPGTSVNLEGALQSADLHLGEGSTASGIARFLELSPVLARRHYIETGTLRFFESEVIAGEMLTDSWLPEPSGDGMLLFVLTETESERLAVRGIVARFADLDTAIILISEPLGVLRAELHDVQRWRWVLSNYAELGDDPYALAEVERQFHLASEALMLRLGGLLPINGPTRDSTEVWHCGKRIATEGESLTTAVSRVCDLNYSLAPQVHHELLNRSKLSSAAAAARMRLIEAMFSSPTQPELGIDSTKAPPERSMYLSVLSKGNVHLFSEGGYRLQEPSQDEDTLNLRPALTHLVQILESANGERVNVSELMDALRKRPFGVRDGVSGLLLAILLATRPHELAVYENGTFLHRFDGPGFMRLLRQPKLFDIQLCQVSGIRMEVFRRLHILLNTPKATSDQVVNVLDVVTPLCEFAAALPECTRRATNLPPFAGAVRDVLLRAREPASLVFSDLPLACGSPPFEAGGVLDETRITDFLSALQGALKDLQSHWPELLERIQSQLFLALREPRSGERVQIALRAKQVSSFAVNPNLRAFAGKLADAGLAEMAWLQAVSTVVQGKPPSRWVGPDYQSWLVELEAVSGLFLRTEAASFTQGEADEGGLRIGLTRSTGEEFVRVLNRKGGVDNDAVKAIASKVSKELDGSKEVRLAALCQVLWNELESEDGGENGT